MSEVAASASSPSQAGSNTSSSNQSQPQGERNARQEATQIETMADPQYAAQEAAAQEERELAEDMYDAYVKKKVNGKVTKVKVSELLKSERLADASEQKYNALKQNAQKMYQQLQQIEEIKKNPDVLFQQMGIDPYQWAEQRLQEKLQQLEMTPEQRKIAEYQQRYEQERQQREQLMSHFEKQQQEAQQSHLAERYDADLSQAFQKHGLPKAKFYAQQVAAVMLGNQQRIQQAMEQGLPPDEMELSADEAAAIVKRSFTSQAQEYLRGLDVSQLREWLGAEKLKALREDDVRRFQTQKSAPTKPGIPTGNANKPDKQVFRTDGEYRAWVESLKNR